MSTYYVHSLGCRASAADGDAIAAALEREGGLAPSSMEEAQIIVVNTCSVTAEAERTARATIRRARRHNPGARVVVTGCYAQRAPAELAALPGVHAVVGNSHKKETAQVALAGLSRANFIPLAQLTAGAETLHAPFPVRWVGDEHELAHTSLPTASFRTRPILKVQEGCGNRCSFCVIPETRGPSRSVSLNEALAFTCRFADEGGQELVLSGINLGRWGRDLRPAQSLAALVRALLEQTNLPRLRLSSMEPMDWTPELLALFAEHSRGAHPRLAPHAHLPLQSGSDEILRRMHRRYRPWHYAARLQEIRDTLPDAAIGADVMVGFPGETDACFQQTYDLIAASPLTYLHLFPFSPRPRTAAEALHRAAPVGASLVRERMKALQQLAEEKRMQFAARFVGRTLSAVTLRDSTALTANFLRVSHHAAHPANRLVPLRIVFVSGDEIHAVHTTEGS